MTLIIIALIVSIMLLGGSLIDSRREHAHRGPRRL
jgi:hypothetical protein